MASLIWSFYILYISWNLAEKKQWQCLAGMPKYYSILTKRLRARGMKTTACSPVFPRVICTADPQPHGNPAAAQPHQGTLSPSHLTPQGPLVSHHATPALSCSSSSASDFIWLPENVDYAPTRFQAPTLWKGLSEVGVWPKKNQQLGSCICSYSAAQTPRGRHPCHEYFQDIRVNKNISSTEPNVNQPLFKSTEIKHLPVLRELTQAYTLLDPKQHLSRTQDACCSRTTLAEINFFHGQWTKTCPSSPASYLYHEGKPNAWLETLPGDSENKTSQPDRLVQKTS